MQCPYCGETQRFQSRGPKANGKRQYYCLNENTSVHQSKSRFFVVDEDFDYDEPVFQPKAPKILLFDLETSRIETRSKVFSLWEQNLRPQDITKDWIILTFSAKWLYEPNVMSFACTQKEIRAWDDGRIVGELWNLIDEADVIIAHNIAFDERRSMTRFVYHNMQPPSQYKKFCTLQAARRYLNVTSNSLDYLGDYFGLGRKIVNEYGLWDKVEDYRHPEHLEAMKRMRIYCNQDVNLLEQVYLRLRPYAVNHPNLGVYGPSEDNYTCPCCANQGSLEWNDEKLFENRYPTGRCNVCNAPVIGKENKQTKEKRKMMSRR